MKEKTTTAGTEATEAKFSPLKAAFCASVPLWLPCFALLPPRRPRFAQRRWCKTSALMPLPNGRSIWITHMTIRFDPDQIAVDGAFTGPAGQKLLVPGYWVPQPQGHFFLRFAATAPGQWTLIVHAKDRAGEASLADPGSFDVKAAKNDGFISMSRLITGISSSPAVDPFLRSALISPGPILTMFPPTKTWFTHPSAMRVEILPVSGFRIPASRLKVA